MKPRRAKKRAPKKRHGYRHVWLDDATFELLDRIRRSMVPLPSGYRQVIGELAVRHARTSGWYSNGIPRGPHLTGAGSPRPGAPAEAKTSAGAPATSGDHAP